MEDLASTLDALLLFRPGGKSLLSRLCRGRIGAGELICEAVSRGWQGNLWHCLLAHTLAAGENPFSLARERRQAPRDSLWDLALSDMAAYRRLFDSPPPLEAMPLLADFRHESLRSASPAAAETSALARELFAAGTPEAMLERLSAYYESHGPGMFGMGQIFRAGEEKGRVFLYPVEDRRPVHLSELVGYEAQKELLLENTLAFLRGRHANNVLLYGDAGTGKSTSIQAIAGEYAPDGLRLIELYKSQFSLIPEILSRIKGRNYRFILFLDDLSFEADEVEYKHLKAVMEGGAEAPPENVLIYATSNRRHLIRETWNDRSDMEHDGDIHRSDTMEEKLSLAGRFGLQIYYPNPSFEEYHAIVKALAERTPELSALSDTELRAAAAAWQVRRGSRSGRTARQLINDLLCRAGGTAPESEESHAHS